MLKLWGRTNSINVMKVIWTLEEIGLIYERVDAGMEFGVVNTENYKLINPNSRVPTIDDDGFTLFESNTIVRYLCAKHSMGKLYPEDIRARADAERWMDWATAQVQPVITPVFWNIIRSTAEKRDLKAIADNTVATNKMMWVLEWGLANRPYLGGDVLGMGDIVVGAWVHRWYALPIERPDLPLVLAYYKRLLERPAYQLHVAQPLS
jgi:glutathione S-transferase